jgi:hypothetical protein
MAIIWFTLTAIALYLVSDWLLERIESAMGKRLEYRSLIFFAILLSLALVTFSMIQAQTGTA